MKRASGVLLPVFSLPSKYGIGCFSKEAYKFIDQLKEAGQSYWQILPLGPTGYGDSPDQFFSTYAGNPYFIDLKTLIKEGLLTKKECKVYDFGEQADSIDYEKIYNSRFKVLKKAFEATCKKRSTENLKEEAPKIMAAVSDDAQLHTLWKSYQKKYPYAADISYEDIMESTMLLWSKIQ